MNRQTLKPARGSTLAPEEHRLLGCSPQQRSVHLLSAEAIIVLGIYKSPVVQVVWQNMCKCGQRCCAVLSEAYVTRQLATRDHSLTNFQFVTLLLVRSNLQKFQSLCIQEWPKWENTDLRFVSLKSNEPVYNKLLTA